ncbi:hypothetical protein EYR36_005091 [Pleurotus pulmonarius]|nr:hypothetical protein EYR36_005091 [Pleurotus pulmonarius]
MAPRPPYATDIPDEEYDSPQAQTRRLRQPKPQDPSARSSTYDVYNNYLAAGDNNPNGTPNPNDRNSGVGALGLGLMNADMSDDDDDSDDESGPRSNAKQQQQQGGRQAALLAATSENNNNSRSINAKSPPPIAAPRPGYPAPIAALNLARPPPAASPSSPQGRQHHAPPNPFDPPMQNPFDDPSSHNHTNNNNQPNFNFEFADSGPRRQPPGIQIPNNTHNMPPPPASPRMPNTPHPLLPPMTPITPAFVRPTPGPPADREVKFHAEAIIRSDHEGALLPKRGERGDDFWRRFSMIAKVENEKQTTEKQSLWLRKTQSGTNRLSRWVYVLGIVLLILIAGGIALGVYASKNDDDSTHEPPTVFGGAANEASVPDVGDKKEGSPTVRSSFHVQPTRTLDNRAGYAPQETGVVGRDVLTNVSGVVGGIGRRVEERMVKTHLKRRKLVL